MDKEKDPCADCRTATEVDCLAILLALAAVTYTSAHYIPHDVNHVHLLNFIKSPHVRTTLDILERLGLDFIRFILSILGIIVLLLLECKKALSSLFRRLWLGSFISFLGTWLLVVERLGLQYDKVKHSHLANATRQRLRAARARFATVLYWGVPVAAVTMLLHGTPDDTTFLSTREQEVRPYVVPNWVIDARPENRLRDRSSSHYRPAAEYVAVVEDHSVWATQSVKSLSLDTQFVETPRPGCPDVEAAIVEVRGKESKSEDTQGLKTQDLDSRGSGSESIVSRRTEAQSSAIPVVEPHCVETQAIESSQVASQPMESQRTESPTNGCHIIEETQIFRAENADAQSTKTITRTIKDWHTDIDTETETETTTVSLSFTEAQISVVKSEPATTAPIAAESSLTRDGAYRYCSECQQRHCCQFP